MTAALARVAFVLAGASPPLPAFLPPGDYEPRKERRLELDPGEVPRVRDDTIARTRVWRRPAPLTEPVLARDRGTPPFPPEGGAVVCKFRPKPASGRTPKFECVLRGGEVVKVKYGGDPEISTEVAASRILAGLGFGSDHMYPVRVVRCFGCPEDPFPIFECLASPFDAVRESCQEVYGTRRPDGAFEMTIDYARYVDFEDVAVERRLEGREIVTGEREGWSFAELDRVDPRRAGSGRAERDALKLAAVLLNHWDNKEDNQRLICPPGAESSNGGCRRPFAYLHDVGGTFGGLETKAQRKLDLVAWRATRVWKDHDACRVDIASPPFHGATFEETRVSEAGRRFLADRLRRLSRRQLREVFRAARFDAPRPERTVYTLEAWVAAFEEKVRQIADRKPCPAA
jgi:hypothetical protein